MKAGRPPARVQKAKRTLARRLASEPGFVGVGVTTGGSGNYEIVVLVANRASALLTKVPPRWEGIPVRTQVSGIPRKF